MWTLKMPFGVHPRRWGQKKYKCWRIGKRAMKQFLLDMTTSAF